MSMNITKKAMNNIMKKIPPPIIYCIRHGEATHNVDFVKYGMSTYYDKTKMDTKLTSKVENQARNLGKTWIELKEKNQDNKIDLIITSPLSRCLQTTTGIFGYNPIAPILSFEECREYPLGTEYCNKRKNIDFLKEKYPHVNFSNILSNEDINWSERKETPEELEKRVENFKEILNIYIKKNNYKKIVVVSHSTFLRKFIYDKFDEIFENELPHCTPINYNFIQNIY